MKKYLFFLLAVVLCGMTACSGSDSELDEDLQTRGEQEARKYHSTYVNDMVAFLKEHAVYEENKFDVGDLLRRRRYRKFL